MEKEIKKENQPRFKAWIRAVALLVVVVFVPEQTAWAMGYDPSVLWAPKFYLGTGQAGYVANFVAENVRRSLNTLVNKPLGQVQIAQNLVVNVRTGTQQAAYFSRADIKKIYDWLRDPATQIDNYCGVYALHSLLKAHKIEISLEELALRLVLVDLLTGNIKELKGKLKTSLFALDRVADSFGIRLYPIKVQSDQLINESTNKVAQFIAHFNSDHFTYVIRMTEGMVYYKEKEKEEFLPIHSFLSKLSGYLLVEKEIPDIEVEKLTEEESKGILGGYTYPAGNYEAQDQRLIKRLGERPQGPGVGNTFRRFYWDARMWSGRSRSLGNYRFTAGEVVDLGITVALGAIGLGGLRAASQVRQVGTTINAVTGAKKVDTSWKVIMAARKAGQISTGTAILGKSALLAHSAITTGGVFSAVSIATAGIATFQGIPMSALEIATMGKNSWMLGAKIGFVLGGLGCPKWIKGYLKR
jgi:hypothetical protein